MNNTLTNHHPFHINGDKILTFDGVEVGKLINEVYVLQDEEDYADDFGTQWAAFPKTQLDSYSGTSISEDRLREIFQSDLSELKGKKILEIGCGSGRFTEILIKHGACIDSLDLSKAIFVNHQNNASTNKMVRFIKSDFLKAPLEENFYDYVLGMGFVQHTPDSEKTIKKMISHCKKGGFVVFDHYISGIFVGNNRRIVARLVRSLILNSNIKDKIKFIKKIYDFFYPIHKFFQFSSFLSKIIRTISPIMTHHGSLDLSEKQFYEWGLLDTHDNLTDFYSHKMSIKQMNKLLSKFNIQSFQTSKGTNGINVKILK